MNNEQMGRIPQSKSLKSINEKLPTKKDKIIFDEITINNQFHNTRELSTLPVEIAKIIAKQEGKGIWLDGLTSISDSAAFYLSKHQGSLKLDGLTSISENAAKHFAMYKGVLSMKGLVSITDEAARYLYNHHGILRLNDTIQAQVDKVGKNK